MALATFVVILLRVDTEGWPLLLAGLVGTPLAGFALWHMFIAAERRGWIHPRADPGHVHPESIGPEPSAIPAPVLPHDSNDRLTTFVVVALAVTVVLSALSGWGYSWSDTHADQMALHARGYAAEIAKHSYFLGRAQERIGELATNLECRARLAAISQRLDRFHRDEEEEQHAERWRDETTCERRWDKEVDDPRVGADADQDFPHKILRGVGQTPISTRLGETPRVAEFHAWQSLAMRDVEATHSVDSRRTATSFLATLTLFAIALYMLGQALGMGRHRSAYVLAAAGVLFGVVGLGLYASTAFAGLGQPGPPPADKCVTEDPDLPEPSEPWARPAYDYAIGMMSLRIYDDAEKAVRYLGCAVDLRPDFADAARRLALAANLAGSLDSGERYSRVYQPDKLRNIIARERAAIGEFKQNDLPVSAWFLNSFAFHNLLDALGNKNGEELSASIDAAREAIGVAASPGHAAETASETNCLSVCRFYLGLALLARGQIPEARNAYADGVRALEGRRSEQVAGALTDLETLAAARCGPSMRPDDEAAGCAGKLGVDQMKALLVRGQASEGLPRVVANENFTLSVSGSELTAILRDPDLAKGNLWLVWYRLEPTWKSWRALQRLSGPIEDKPKPDGTLTVQRSFLQRYPSAPKCLAPGKYRAELYANGSLVATKLVDLAPTQMIRKQFLDLNMQFCMPSGWTVARGGSTDGLMRRFEAPDHKPAAFLFTYYGPRPSRLPNAGEDDGLINGARDSLLKYGLISGKEALMRFDPQDPLSPPKSAALVFRFWRTHEGEAHIIIARSDALEADQLSQMLQSAETIEDETGGNFE